MSRILAVLAILAIVGTALFFGLREAGVIKDEDVPSALRPALGSTTSTSVRRSGTSSSTTTRSASTATSAASTSSTVAAAATTTTTTATGASTTTTSPGGSVPDCGRGAARATAGVTNVEAAYELTATVRNDADRAIEIDTLVVRATFPGGRTANFPSDATKFAGARVQPGQEVTFAMRESRATEAPTSFEVAEFSYHTADLPQCKSS
jgi:hypothetical protein